MPRYDVRCGSGHTNEVFAGFDEDRVPCPDCGTETRRCVPERPPLAGGWAIPPMRERRIPLSRAVEAQHEMVHQAARAGVTPPDVLGIARRQAAAIAKAAPELVTGT